MTWPAQQALLLQWAPELGLGHNPVAPPELQGLGSRKELKGGRICDADRPGHSYSENRCAGVQPQGLPRVGAGKTEVAQPPPQQSPSI